MIPGRHPVLANLLIRDFVRSLESGRPMTAPTIRARPRPGPARSPAGAGRCTSPRRSASATPSATSAIADELRKLHPDLEIDWLAQRPVTAVLEARGERIHPLSA